MNSELVGDNTSKIIAAFDGCTSCGAGNLYISEDAVGYIIARAMDLRAEIVTLASQVDRQNQHIAELSIPR